MPLSAVRPSHVRPWTAKLKAEGARAVLRLRAARPAVAVNATPSTTGCSPGTRARGERHRGGQQRPYVATTEQVWALHDAMPDHLRPAVLLGAFAGLRTAEACGLRVADVDFMRASCTPTCSTRRMSR